jgi:hypothetical protein
VIKPLPPRRYEPSLEVIVVLIAVALLAASVLGR